MFRRPHPFITLALALLPIAFSVRHAFPQAAPALVFLAYGFTLLEFKKYTSVFQFGMLLVRGVWLGALLDVGARVFPCFTLAMLLSAVATDLRQAYMPVFTYVRFLWMEPLMLAVAAACYLSVALVQPFQWDIALLPLLPFGFAGSLSFGYVQDGALLKRKASFGYRISTGRPAPDFVLPDQNGNSLRLADYRGKHPVLLIFVRGDWCPGCHMMLRTYEKSRARFMAKGVHVLGIGPDSADVNKNMVERIGVGYKLLSDREQTISQRYGVVYNNPIIELGIDYAEGIPLPASFLVDINGIVRYVSRPDRVGEFLDPTLIFGVLDALPDENGAAWKAA